MNSFARRGGGVLALFAASILAPACEDGKQPPPPEHDSSTDGTVSDVVVDDAPADAAADHEDEQNFPDPDGSFYGCKPTATWSAGTLAAGIPSGSSIVAFAITADELTTAWVEAADGTTALHAADRATKTDAFGQAQAVAWNSYDTTLGISISSDGLTIAATKANHRGFGLVARATRADTFGAPDETTFTSINAWIGSLNGTAANPTLGADGQSFVYSQFGASSTIYESTLSDAGVSWPIGTPLAGAPLDVVTIPNSEGGSTSYYRHPVALSSDGLTLFIDDEYPSKPTARAVYRTSPSAAFSGSVLLGAWSAVHPNAGCDRLYYVESGDVKAADRQ